MESSFLDLSKCSICPHNCQADRNSGPAGKCRTDSGINIASVTLHHGEEPAISGTGGICNIFFSGCNLRCIYCQNHQISGVNRIRKSEFNTVEHVAEIVESVMQEGARSVGFVSPSHMLPQVKKIIEELNHRNLEIIKVYNTNSYERTEGIQLLEGLIDVYLPDFKYADSELAYRYSGVKDYLEFASQSIKEMFRQKGSRLFVSEEGYAESGIIIRHLVLPGAVENSLNVLRYIAEEISTNVHISLMSQYYPTSKVKDHPVLGRNLLEREYSEVVEEMYRLGFSNGYTQEFESSQLFKPDFNKENPFK